MEQNNKQLPEKPGESFQEKTDKWIDKAEQYIDKTSEKIHQSDAYREVDKKLENATKKLFRQAGNLWGKSQRFLKK